MKFLGENIELKKKISNFGQSFKHDAIWLDPLTSIRINFEKAFYILIETSSYLADILSELPPYNPITCIRTISITTLLNSITSSLRGLEEICHPHIRIRVMGLMRPHAIRQFQLHEID